MYITFPSKNTKTALEVNNGHGLESTKWYGCSVVLFNIVFVLKNLEDENLDANEDCIVIIKLNLCFNQLRNKT